MKKNEPAGFWYFAWRLYSGEGIRQNQNEGRKMMIKAAECGWRSHAEWIYRIILDGGCGFEQSIKEANRFLEFAIQRERIDEEELN